VTGTALGGAARSLASTPAPVDRPPVAGDRARLGPDSRRTMRPALDVVATTISAQHSAATLPWPAVGYQPLAVRAALRARSPGRTSIQPIRQPRAFRRDRP
jgi:hypothetical protein